MAKQAENLSGLLSALILAALCTLGILRLGVKLYEFQVVGAAEFRGAANRQSARRVRTVGTRGSILSRDGEPLAVSRSAACLVCDPKCYQRRTHERTMQAIAAASSTLAHVLGRASAPSTNVIARHILRLRSIPLVVWHDLSEREIAVFSEHQRDYPGFSIEQEEVRVYPQGNFASQLIGYVGRENAPNESFGEKFNFYLPELRGRAGLEAYYDSYLRGVPGVRELVVDANNYTISSRVILEPNVGLNLVLSLDAELQRAAERQLLGCCGACVAIDPRDGAVLAFASAPGFNPNAFVPTLDPALYRRLADDPAQPLLNRASGGAYAPGSTFKPIMALAGLSLGYPADAEYVCNGVYENHGQRLHCASRWGHGALDLPHALMKSCNPFFCNLAEETGTNALVRMARLFGLGRKTGLDLGVDQAGVVPDAEWKMRRYHERWYPADLVQMAIGQGMLLTSPLQMSCLAGALGTGCLVTPRLRVDAPVVRRRLAVSEADLAVVREGMRMVVAGDGESRGTGWRGGAGIGVSVSGKTGTAEVGAGERRRKNTWFIAFAPSEAPRIAIAMVIERGDSGGGTTAPKVAEILKVFFSRTRSGGGTT